MPHDRRLSRPLWRLLLLTVALSVAPAGAASPAPTCQRVRGTAAVTFTTDEGRTLTPTVPSLAGTTYTLGLIATRPAGELLAAVGSRLVVSSDQGCRWSLLANLHKPAGGALLRLAAAARGRSYAWAERGPALFRIDGRRVITLRAPVDTIVDVGADPRLRRRVRLADPSGALWHSENAGLAWRQVGLPPRAGLYVYRTAFDPRDPDHVVIGTALGGAFVTVDGGRTWAQASGLGSTPNAHVNIFNVVISPRDSRVVWAMGIDLSQVDDPAGPFEGRHVYRSVDGGLSFTPVVEHEGGVKLINGPTMAAHPTDPNVLYFVFGTFVGDHGTDLYRYDAGTDEVTWTHNDYHDVSAIAFSRPPGVMYLGLVNEEVQ